MVRSRRIRHRRSGAARGCAQTPGLEARTRSHAQERLTALQLQIDKVTKNRGDVSAAGTTVLSLQLSGQHVEGLQAIIYVPPQDG
jgi:hypothetical protein